MKLVEIVLTVKTRLFFVSIEIFKIETFELRLGQVEIFIKIVKIYRDCQDFWDLSRLFEIYWDILTLLRLFFVGLQAQKSWQIEKSWSRKMRQTVNIYQLFLVSTDFLISINTFGTGRWCWDKIKISQSRLRLLDHQDKLFEIVKIFLTVETYFLSVLRLRVLIETNRDPRAYLQVILLNEANQR